MRWIKRLLLAVAGLLILGAVLLAGVIVVDGWNDAEEIGALTTITIPQEGGPEVAAYVARPTGPGPYPAVIMIHEWWGLREEIVGKAELLAQQGYVVIAPDTYRGATTALIPRALFLRLRTPQSRVNQDLNAVYQWLAAQPEVDAERIGITGFCYGGGVSLAYSLTNPSIAATGVFYGTPITEPNSLKALPAPVLGIFGGADQQIPVSEVRAFEAALETAGVPHQITVYDGQPHAFVGSVAEIAAGGDEAAAWAELLSFLDQTLRR